MSTPRQPARRRPPRTGSAGFTLVEILVASVLLGLISLLLFNGMRFVQRAFANVDQRREAVESTVTGIGLMRGTLGRAVPLFRKVENRERLVFEGGEERVRFATFEPDYLPGWPLVAYEYALTARTGSTVLVVRRANLDPSRPDLDTLDAAEARTLLGLPAGARFTYFGAATSREARSWRATWVGAELLPEAVRVGASGQDPGWPDFVLPLAINTPVACLNANAQGSGGADTQSPGGAGAQSARGCGR